MIVSRDVVFTEDKMYKDMLKPAEKQTENDRSFIEVEQLNQDVRPAESATQVTIPDHPQTAGDTPSLMDYQLARDRVRREVRPPARFTEDLTAYAFAVAELEDHTEPLSYGQAITSPNCEKWKLAMNEEMNSLKENNTWELVTRPKGQKLVGCKWLYKIKPGMNNEEPVRFKARLVARGFAQKEGLDYTEVFSPVVMHSSIRILLALIAYHESREERGWGREVPSVTVRFFVTTSRGLQNRRSIFLQEHLLKNYTPPRVSNEQHIKTHDIPGLNLHHIFK